MDGENNGKPYEQMNDLGGFPIIFGNTHKDICFKYINKRPGKRCCLGMPWNLRILKFTGRLHQTQVEDSSIPCEITLDQAKDPVF